MTTSTLRAVTLKTVANYTQAAERAVVAYRVGGQRLIAAMQRGVDLAAAQGPERLATALRRASGNVGGLATQSLDRVSTRTERAIEISSTGVSSQLVRVADLAEGVNNDLVANGLQAAARISLPGAQVALALSERLVAGADKLPGSAVVKAQAQAKAKASSMARARRVAKAEAADEAVVKTAAARVRKAKPVAAVVEAAAPKAARKPAARKPAAAPAPVKAAAPRARRAAKASPAVKSAAGAQDAAAAA